MLSTYERMGVMVGGCRACIKVYAGLPVKQLASHFFVWMSMSLLNNFRKSNARETVPEGFTYVYCG